MPAIILPKHRVATQRIPEYDVDRVQLREPRLMVPRSVAAAGSPNIRPDYSHGFWNGCTLFVSGFDCRQSANAPAINIGPHRTPATIGSNGPNYPATRTYSGLQFDGTNDNFWANSGVSTFLPSSACTISICFTMTGTNVADDNYMSARVGTGGNRFYIKTDGTNTNTLGFGYGSSSNVGLTLPDLTGKLVVASLTQDYPGTYMGVANGKVLATGTSVSSSWSTFAIGAQSGNPGGSYNSAILLHWAATHERKLSMYEMIDLYEWPLQMYST